MEEPMKLWLVSRTDDVSYDEYDALVVRAKTEEEARNIIPRDNIWSSTWTNNPATLSIELLGIAWGGQAGIVLGSFRAG